ncbi:MAG: hypothetical protein QNJ72_05630 [Pleurocapsa sp. MO_226.B13]|nr:hypothetical protein [Pleurocapsa sp. MO_226.B13]
METIIRKEQATALRGKLLEIAKTSYFIPDDKGVDSCSRSNWRSP